MLKPENYTPIDIDRVLEERKLIYDIPYSKFDYDWDIINDRLLIVNDLILPYTLRTFYLNELPYSIIEILNKLKYTKDQLFAKCPECGENLIEKNSGIKCSSCEYWFCY